MVHLPNFAKWKKYFWKSKLHFWSLKCIYFIFFCNFGLNKWLFVCLVIVRVLVTFLVHVWSKITIFGDEVYYRNFLEHGQKNVTKMSMRTKIAWKNYLWPNLQKWTTLVYQKCNLLFLESFKIWYWYDTTCFLSNYPVTSVHKYVWWHGGWSRILFHWSGIPSCNIVMNPWYVNTFKKYS